MDITKFISAQMQRNAWVAVSGEGFWHITPYADNILHVSFSKERQPELPMWGIEAKEDTSVQTDYLESKTDYIVHFPEMSIIIKKETAEIIFRDKNGRKLVSLLECELKETIVLKEHTYHVKAVFSARESETYYGLGQHQDGNLNLGGREQIMWHDYSHKGGEIVAVPFMVTNQGYGILFDNASKVRVTPGVGRKTIWEAEVGEAVSFFIISGKETDDMYKGFRKLCGITPMPPRAGLGFIQCKQRYATERELMEVAKTYYEKGYPCDIFVVDWFHWKVLGDLSPDIEFWPDSKAMNRVLEKMGYEVMISCWPRFMKESNYYDFLEKKGWFMKDANGETVYGTPDDQRGALIDTTNPECGKWYFETIRRNYGSLGYKYWWTDENEPDITPHKSYLSAGTGARVHNIYPLTHSKCIYEGHRENYDYRCLTLSRAAFLGAQKYGTTFWSSDIFPEWDVLKRQIPTALNFCASGMPYWSSDIGGWQTLADEESSEDYSSLLIGTTSQGEGTVTKKNYTELFIRWFQFGVFCPTFRTHGTRKNNEVWSYGEEAEKILVRYLKLRYKLMPYIYSLAYQVHLTGAPFMRALWMDYSEEKCAKITDEFMFGPALLIAPVVEQNALSREVYLPAGTMWTDYWTNKSYAGGQTITAEAPIEVLPVFVKAGSIIPMGEEVKNVKKEQCDITLYIYPGGDNHFSLYSDDGKSYTYEEGCCELLNFSWNEEKKELTVNEQPLSSIQNGKRYTVILMNNLS